MERSWWERVRPAASTTAGLVIFLAGPPMGAALQQFVTRTPRLPVFNQTIIEACPPLNSGNFNLRACDPSALVPVLALFSTYNNGTTLGIGILFAVSGAGIGFMGGHYLRRAEETGSQETNFNRFVRVTAPTFRDIFYSIGGTLAGTSLQNIVNQGIAPSQQILDAICVNNSGTTLLVCDINRLNSVASIFAQPSITMLVVGIALLALLGVWISLYAWCWAPPLHRRDETDALNPRVASQD